MGVFNKFGLADTCRHLPTLADTGVCWGSVGGLLGVCWGSVGSLLGVGWGSVGGLLGVYWVYQEPPKIPGDPQQTPSRPPTDSQQAPNRPPTDPQQTPNRPPSLANVGKCRQVSASVGKPEFVENTNVLHHFWILRPQPVSASVGKCRQPSGLLGTLFGPCWESVGALWGPCGGLVGALWVQERIHRGILGSSWGNSPQDSVEPAKIRRGHRPMSV